MQIEFDTFEFYIYDQFGNMFLALSPNDDFFTLYPEVKTLEQLLPSIESCFPLNFEEEEINFLSWDQPPENPFYEQIGILEVIQTRSAVLSRGSDLITGILCLYVVNDSNEE